MTKRWLPPMVCLITGIAGTLCAQQTIDYDAEIKRIRKELMQVQEERSRVKEDMDKDRKDFEEYRNRTLKKMRSIRHETDSVQQETYVFKQRIDSLSALVEKEAGRKRYYEILQDNFRDDIAESVDTLLMYARAFPPSVSQKSVSALSLLKNELATKTVDNIEALNRFSQITKDMHETGSGIQIIQGSSPVPEIRGTTYRIRLGTFFEAVVNSKGTQAVRWNGYDDNGNPLWKKIEDPVAAAAILKAVNVREGKSLPALVELPMGTMTIVKGE